MGATVPHRGAAPSAAPEDAAGGGTRRRVLPEEHRFLCWQRWRRVRELSVQTSCAGEARVAVLPPSMQLTHLYLS